jgi:hypothetical protein
MFPRLRELKAAVPDPTHPDAYFQNFDRRVQEGEHIQRLYLRYERPLQLLDAEAWRDLKERATPLTMKRHPTRGWQGLFDTLNEGLGYAHLHGIGCTGIAFLPRASKRTPDLGASHNGQRVLCEVKTINVSKDEAERRDRTNRGEIKAFKVATSVSDGMLGKVTATLASAVEQLAEADSAQTARRIVFTALHFDDWVGDYQTEYIEQLDAHLLANPVVGAELVFAPASNLFDRRFTMQAATIVEL